MEGKFIRLQWHEFDISLSNYPEFRKSAYSLKDKNGRILANNKNVGGLFTHEETIKMLFKNEAKYFLCINIF